ncbi:QWRF motif-containing protein 2-like [Andrographis paniculata]|uniref:QWRF motif-containing protein 2-like n=1 Tax=Andrographis paniculata TaxID=175694 RepID=UPI0021E84B57|nr:QWRF motif-containing protein 2-like [Andrographis paniculata]
MVAAAVSGDAQTPKFRDEHSRRPPSLKDNSNGVGVHRKPKSRSVSSRYMSMSSPSTTSTSTSSSNSSSSASSSSRRFPSPLIPRNSASASASPRRSASVDRRRAAASRPLIPELDVSVSAATKLLATSTRSLSVSFQGKAFSLPISKAKVTTTQSSPNLRKGMPEKRRTITPLKGEGNHQPDQYLRWPAVTSKGFGSGNGKLSYQSMIDERSCRPSLHDNNVLHDSLWVPSDSDSVSSGSTNSGPKDCSRGRNVAHGIIASARFWQETNSQLRRLQDPGSHLETSPLGSKLIAPPKLRRYSSDGGPSRAISPSPPVRPAAGGSGIRQAFPSKATKSPLRGHSPSRIRNSVSTISSNYVETTPSVLSFAVDVRRGKVGENRIVAAHSLRLLYNRHLQWRIVNARMDSVLFVQKHNTEKHLWNAWITTSDIRDTLTRKIYRLRLLRAKLKLASIIKGQMTFLEDWASLEKDQSISLLSAIEALKASTLRLPVNGGVMADTVSLKDAIHSAVDVIQAMGSSIHSLLLLVEEVNCPATEIVKVTSKERALLKQCTDRISILTAAQVGESSLRMHIMQQSRRRKLN